MGEVCLVLVRLLKCFIAHTGASTNFVLQHICQGYFQKGGPSQRTYISSLGPSTAAVVCW